MSSEISIEEAGRLKPAPTTAAGAGVEAYVGAGFSRPDDGFRPWHFFVLASILLATVAVVMARQSAPEHLILMSFTIAAAGAAAAAFYRMLAPLTAPVVLRMGQAVSERTRAALEREKLLVLRSIKDLEFDRAMGKLSQKDFEEMAPRLRTRAMSLMKQLDLGSAGYSDAIEQELRGRLQSEGRHVFEGRLPSTSLRAGPSTSRRAGPSTSLRAGEPTATAGHGAMVDCGACAAANDPDAVFCKKCGTRLHG